MASCWSMRWPPRVRSTATTCCTPPGPTCCAGSAARPTPWPPTRGRSSSPRATPTGRSWSAAAAYAEGGATLSEPGGSSAMARRAWGDLVGFIAGWATVLDFVITVSLSALFLPHYVSGALGQDPGALSVREAAAYAVGILVIVTTVRLARRTAIYTTGVAIAALDLIVQVSLAVLGLALLFSWSSLTRNIDVGADPTWNSIAFSFPIAMIGYAGLEKVSSVAALAKDPERSVPDSVRSSVFTVV